MERATSWRSPEGQELVTPMGDGLIYLKTPGDERIGFDPSTGEPLHLHRGVPDRDDEPLPPAPTEPDARALLVRIDGTAALAHFLAMRERLRRLRQET